MMPHPEAPDDVAADQHLYVAWRYGTLSADDTAVLALFRDEWRRIQEAVISVQLSATAAPGTSIHPDPK